MHVQLAPDRGRPQPCFHPQVIIMIMRIMIDNDDDNLVKTLRYVDGS